MNHRPRPPVLLTAISTAKRKEVFCPRPPATPMEEKQQQRFLKLKNKIDALAAKRAATSDPEALAAIDAELAAARAKVKKARRVGGDGATKECAVCGAPTARTVSVKGATVHWCSMACQRVGWKAAKEASSATICPGAGGATGGRRAMVTEAPSGGMPRPAGNPADPAEARAGEVEA